jgi:hypothetical protein
MGFGHGEKSMRSKESVRPVAVTRSAVSVSCKFLYADSNKSSGLMSPFSLEFVLPQLPV